MMNKALLKSERPDWNTPQNFLEYVYRFFPSGLDIDPCSNDASLVKASVAMKGPPGRDGLMEAWSGNVYVNPPYGRNIGHWIEKICREAKRCAQPEAYLGCEVVALVPSRTDTRWFHRAMNGCRSVCLIKGRLTFVGAPNPAPFPSAVFYWGSRPTAFAKVFAHLGPIIEQAHPKNEYLFIKVKSLAFGTRVMSRMAGLNVTYVGELVQRTESELLHGGNFGRESLKEVKDVLEPLGLGLGMKVCTFDLYRRMRGQES
jgi:hypothetical protein